MTTTRALKLMTGVALMALLMSACETRPPAVAAQQQAAAEHEGAAHAAHGARPELPTADATSYSVYELPAEWQDQAGATRTLTSLAGRPVVMAMVYTSCTYACPRILSDMKRIEGELGSLASDVAFVMVSIDPARDTPDRLREYATATRLDPEQWTLLTSTEDATLELAALLGVRYRRVNEREFEHSNVLTVLDAEGRIVHRQVGLGTDPSATVRSLASLVGPGDGA